MKEKAKIGDVCEIQTSKGLAYVQYVLENPDMGQLVRVLPGRFHVRPTDFNDLTHERELYFVFYTLNLALRKGQTEVVSNQSVPQWTQVPPRMRWAGQRDGSGKTVNWKILTASDSLTADFHRRTPEIKALSPEQVSLSIHQLWPHPVLVRELTRDWHPQRAEELEIGDRLRASSKGSHIHESLPQKHLRHYLYFPTKTIAEEAGEILKRKGLRVDIRRGSDEESWLTLAIQGIHELGNGMEDIRQQMEAVAEQMNGDYDGWEVLTDISDPNLPAMSSKPS